jgi:hypothetical protein
MDKTMRELKTKFLKLKKTFKKYGNNCIYNRNGVNHQRVGEAWLQIQTVD